MLSWAAALRIFSMKLDPNEYCVVYEQSIIWALIHDILAHPLMALTLYKVELFINFHNFTSAKAWKRSSSISEVIDGGKRSRSMTEIDLENAKILRDWL